MAISLPVLNAETATFECIFGRGCDGICCQNGRPCPEPEEREQIQENLEKFLPEMRPEAARLARMEGFSSNRSKSGGKMLRVIGGWCIFFNQGCVLHKVGAAEGDAYKYKPYVCAVFPLQKHATKPAHYVRQWGYEGEVWDLFCLNPEATKKKAVETLQDEIGIITRHLESAEESTDTPTKPADAVAPVKKARKKPAKQTAAPAKKTAAPAKKTAAPAKKTAVPAKKTAAPARKPAKQTAARKPRSANRQK